MCRMFPTLKIFIIFLVTPSYTFPAPTNGNGETDAAIKKRVEKELAPISDILKKITDSLTSENLKIEAGKIEGLVQGKIERAVGAELRVEKLLANEAVLKFEKGRSDVYRVLLGIGRRVDTLEQILSCDSDIQLLGPRDERWRQILKLETPIVREFRSRIIAAGVTVELFSKAVQKICQEKNDCAGHGDVSLPEELDLDNVDTILTKMKIPKDECYKRTIELLISPLTLPSTKTPATS